MFTLEYLLAATASHATPYYKIRNIFLLLVPLGPTGFLSDFYPEELTNANVAKEGEKTLRPVQKHNRKRRTARYKELNESIMHAGFSSEALMPRLK